MKTAERRRLIKKRNELMALLGDRCVMCGSQDNLEFDHPHGRHWEARSLARTKRLRLYREDFEVGNLRLLCSACNKIYLPDSPF